MNEVEVYVHIGMHKAASTFIQTQIFDKLAKQRKILYVDPYFRLGIEEVNNSSLVNELHSKIKGIPYFRITEQFRTHIQRGLFELGEKVGLQKIKSVLSDEYLVGAENHNFFMDVNQLLTINQLFEKPQILFVIRRQDDFLESWYANQIRYGRWEPIKQVLNYRDGEFGPWKPSYRLNLDVTELDYYSFVQHLDKIFGRENVTVVPFEQLRHDPYGFVDKVLKFVDEELEVPPSSNPVNKKYPYVTLALTRLINRFTNNGTNACILLPQRPFNIFLRRYAMRPFSDRPRWVNKLLYISNNMSWVNLLYFLGVLVPLKRDFIPPAMARKILEIHCASNKKLAEDRGLPLKKYGYF